MPRTVLRPACPVCSQTLRSNTWIEHVGIDPLSIAHELRYSGGAGGGMIERKALMLGEKSSLDAVVVSDIDRSHKPVFTPATLIEAPPGWPDRLKKALLRAVRALVPNDEGKDLQTELEDPFLTEEEFIEKADAYIQEAQAELSFRVRVVRANRR